jgi:hypothetical protein
MIEIMWSSVRITLTGKTEILREKSAPSPLVVEIVSLS